MLSESIQHVNAFSQHGQGFYLGINMRGVSHREGNEASTEGGVLGRRATSPSLHQLGGLRSAISSPAWSGADPGKFEIWCNFRPQKSLQKYQIKIFLYQ